MLKRTESIYPHKSLFLVFIAALFIIAQIGNNPNVHQPRPGPQDVRVALAAALSRRGPHTSCSRN